MKGLLLSGALLAAYATYAKDKPAYQTGVLLQMDSTSCGMAEKGGKTITDVAFSWGFSSSSHFSRVFRKYFGIAPSSIHKAQHSGL